MTRRQHRFDHTPWHVQGHSRRGYSQVIDSGGDVIAICLGPQHEVTACITAIAPDMYEAIRKLIADKQLDRETAGEMRALLARAQ